MKKYYDIINTLPLSLLLLLLAGGYAGIPSGSITAFVLCVVFTVWTALLRNMKRKERLRSAGIVAVFLAGLYIAAGERYRELFRERYFWIVWLFFLCAAALAAALVMDRSIRLKRTEAAAMLCCLIAGTVMDWKIGKAVFVLVSFVLLVRLAEEVQRKWTKSGYPDIREHITRISPFLAGLCLAVYLLPASSKPYDWQLAKNIYNNTVVLANRIYGYITHPSDEYGEIGFSDKSGFLAGISGGDEEVLYITANEPEIKELRLVGCISGDFRGREWIFDTKSEGFSRMTDTIETSCAVRKHDASARYDYLQKLEMDCTTLFYNTRYIFSPAKIKLPATMDSISGISEKHGSIVSKHRLGYKKSYHVSSYVLNYANPGLQQFLTSAAPITEEEWKQTAGAENVTGKEGYTFGDYQKYREDVYAEYCHPYGLSEEARAVTDAIRSSTSDRYEALKELEAYLRGFEYSTDCGPLPETINDAGSFLDYFLFSSHKGYCMHFATAFVLMANEMGIPCRYVQGYNVSRNPDGSITVKNSNAHSWPEAYFDNVGWTAFEPTPCYPLLSGWKARSADIHGHGSGNYYPAPTEPPSDTEEIPEETEKEEEKLDPLIFIIPSLAATGFLLLFWFIGLSAARRRYRRMSCSDRFIYQTQQNLRLLGNLGFRTEEGETLAEFTGRISASGSEELRKHLGFIPLYESVIYSGRDISEDEVRKAEETNQALRSLVKKSSLRYRLLFLFKR